jgi:ligand-binding sensor domain-containing protein
MRQLLHILIFLPLFVTGQSRIGEWKAHISFYPVIKVAETPESIVAATANGLLFADKITKQLSTKTKADGLSGTGISSIGYASDPKTLLVGYENGHVDLLQNDQIINFPDLNMKAGLSDKTVGRIVCEGNFAWLCCSFGIVKVDLLKVEVAETWYLGAGNDTKAVNDLISFGDSWYAATNRGLFKAAKANLNLQDYRNWQQVLSIPLADSEFTSLAISNGLLYVHDKNNDKMLEWNGKLWQPQYPILKNIKEIKSASIGLIVRTNKEVWLMGNAGNTLINSYFSSGSPKEIDPRDALIDGNGKLWIADHQFGLSLQISSSVFSHLLPNSPRSDQITALRISQEDIFTGNITTNSGGIQEASISILQAGIWQNFTDDDDVGLKSIGPITDFAFSPLNSDEYWASSAGSGLISFQKNRVATRYSELNSPLGAVNGSCIINSLAADGQNNLWYTNPTGKVPLGSYQSNRNFLSLPYPGMNYSNISTGNIIVTGSAIHWVVLPNEGLFAFRMKGNTENISDDQYRKVAVKSRFSNGTTTLITPFSNISAIAEDSNHQLWIGTGTGLVVYSNPDKVFDAEEFYGSQPSLDDGEGLFKPILEKEKITAIAVDGGNRKWIGTAYSGLFLFSEQGDQLLRHFTAKNSPLLSDQICSIAISSGSGEVFISTDRGLNSYKSDANSGESNLNKAYVWPNPVRETFEGSVTVDGLTDQTDVKITDIAGNLVFKTTSLGGRALWNVRNSNGVRVSTGVFLIFCTSPQQKTTKIIKLLVIH